MKLMDIEAHPFRPFLPEEAGVLFLGSFPATPNRWSMDFYYPNFANDFWRIIGLLFFGNPSHFEIRKGADETRNRWDENEIRNFCSQTGIALSDTAAEIRRLKGNASDSALEIISQQDIRALIDRLPCCRAVAATGALASEIVARQFSCVIPPVGGMVCGISPDRGNLAFYRLPSTSRAFPMPLIKKAEFYRKLFLDIGYSV